MRQSKFLSQTSISLYQESLQVAASPCWKMDLSDPISASLSPDAWSPTPAGPMVHTPVSSHRTSAFPPLEQGRLHTNTIRTATSVRYAFSRLQAFSNVQASRFARHPGRSYRCAILIHRVAVAFTSEQNTGRYLPVHRIYLPPESSN